MRAGLQAPGSALPSRVADTRPVRPPEPFTVVPVASPLHDPHALRGQAAPFLAALQALGGTLGDDRAVASDDPLVVLVLTGGTEARVLDLWRRRQPVEPGEPLVLVTHPGHNSLAAGLEAAARVCQDGAGSRVVHLRSSDDTDGLASLTETVEDLTVRRRLHDSRIGLVGEPSDWLVASSPAPADVTATWGPAVVHLTVDEVVQRVHAPVPPAAAMVARSMAAGARSVVEPDDRALAAAARVEPALRALVEAEELDAVAVRCFDLVTGLRTSGCVALAELNDSGVVAGCEGDLTATVAMLWIRALLDRGAWMANPVDVDPVAGQIVLAHCTVPRSMVRSYSLRSHFESGLGVAIAGELDVDAVTLVRLGGRRLDQLWVAEGQALPTRLREGCCRTQLQVALPPAVVRELLAHPLGNHLVLVAGHHADRLRRWWDWMLPHPS